MGQPFGVELVFPIKSPAVRKTLVREETCPQCGGDLDTGWECNDCQFDASTIAYTAWEREMDKKWRGAND